MSSSVVPKSLLNLTSLRTLCLGYSGLHGEFPSGIFHLPHLQNLAIQDDEGLTGHIPDFINSTYLLQKLVLSSTGFSRILPDSIANMKFLELLEVDLLGGVNKKSTAKSQIRAQALELKAFFCEFLKQSMMVWSLREADGGPPRYGGSVAYVDYCHSDEISIIELCNMVSDLGQIFAAVDYYTKVSGEFRILKSDGDAMGLSTLLNADREVEVFCVMDKAVDIYVGTQESQVGKPSNAPRSRTSKPTWNPPRPKTMRTLTKQVTQSQDSNVKISQPKWNAPRPTKELSQPSIPQPNKGKGKVVVTNELVDVQIDEDGDSDDYDVDFDTTDDDDDDEVFYDSDYGLTDDDELFDQNIDKEVVFAGLGNTSAHNAKDYSGVVDELADIDYMDEDSDELLSGQSSSDEEGGSKRDKKKYTVFNEKTEMGNPVFEVGMEFKTHAQFRDAVKEHSIKGGKEITFLKSDRDKVRAKCRDGCPWLIYASYVPSDALYRIKRYDNEHSCNRSFHVPWVSTKWILNKYKERIRRNPTWPVKSLANIIMGEHTVNVDVQKVYRARKMALEMIQGSACEQFNQLWGYLEEVKSSNPGTTIKMKVIKINESDQFAKFKRLYICWGALKRGLLQGIVGIDANNCIYPFAYVVVEKEKYKTWFWFLELLIDDLNIVNSHTFTIMSDKQKGLIEAVQQLLPNAPHRFCVRHLYNNFKLDFKGLALKDVLWKAARATTVPAFKNAM
ncbi:hypothetical protein RHSIM_Rhsim01G0063200 [Rhododendron simsii]|uniref:Transposase n=1 Tax=Rhododendron simsii TaxID=118357 RepID=A0A834HK08_RHOSS|nr:hypothetical protein RHSIM_Rhsim01G0063200 [Rhododendron simsii]